MKKLLVLLMILVATSASAVTVPPWWMIQQSLVDPVTNKVGIGTSTPQASLHNMGYTMLGDASPKIKCRMYTGVMSATASTQVTIAYHGLTPVKIIAATAVVRSTDLSEVYPPNVPGYSGTLLYSFYIGSLTIEAITGADATTILGRQIDILVWYIE